ncbi:unnamed protein product [Phytophthora fragariaefolia]|uniref:Unnamed protein product n=1 Tax=Phytophthora fragariaefolia TaxID=1490495 RepID=A0A9W6TZE4_9STRA|nr:unnamed protein product [Phytophthora fragariaefolia]
MPSQQQLSHRADEKIVLGRRRARNDSGNQVAMRLRKDREKVAEVITNIRDSYEPGQLEVLCDLEWRIKIDKFTDDILTEKIDGIIATVANNIVPNVADEFKLAIKMNPKEADIRERVILFFKAGRQLIAQRG